MVSIGWRNNPEIRNAVMGYRFPITETMEDRWYDQILSDQSGRRASFAIEENIDSVFVGFVHLTEIDWPCRAAQFGIVIGDTSYQCRGIGSEATRLALRYAFDTLNLDRVELRVSQPNARARHVYRKLGFREEGCLRRAAFIDGATIDVVVMGILREEFRDDR
jgi:RimJ/RimL family protein N-acetyltransferase